MQKGFVTIMGDIIDEIGWRAEDGSPIFYETTEEAAQEILDDMLLYDLEFMEGMIEEDEIPDPDDVGYAIQLSETLYQIQDLDNNNLFVWDTEQT